MIQLGLVKWVLTYILVRLLSFFSYYLTALSIIVTALPMSQSKKSGFSNFVHALSSSSIARRHQSLKDAASKLTRKLFKAHQASGLCPSGKLFK